MAKFDFEVGITTSLTAAQGLVLGDPDSGVHESGLSLTLGRKKKDKAFVGSSFTRSLSDFLKAEVRTFTFAMPFCGNRVTVAGAPTDADAIPITGIDALLEGAGMTGSAWGSGVGHQYVFGSPNPISALIYYFGNRLELLDCRCALAIEFVPESIPILTATIEVGSIKDHSVPGYGVPATLTYGEQQTVSAPTIEAVANTWREARGFSTATLNISPTIDDIPDSNAATGVVKEPSDREVSFEGTLFADDTTDEGHEYEQMTASDIATLDQLSFLVGTVMADTLLAEAVGIIIPDPEPDEVTIQNLGTKAAHEVKLIARSATANTELQINFQ
jgi:hypothetical protein